MQILLSKTVFKMKLLLVSCFVALSTFAAGLPTGNNTSGNNVLAPRIIDGEAVSKSLYYEVAIVSDAVPIKLCSGAFISNKWVLTSAFCAKRRPTLRVYYGVNYVYPGRYEGSQLVGKVHCHPGFNALTLDNDIALLELTAAITNPYITTIPLPPNENYNFIGVTATVSGWGPSPNGLSNNYLYCLESKNTVVIENTFCMREEYPMNLNKLCTEDRAICEGDQGAPLVINGRVYGIATAAHNANNCQGANVTPYTRVVPYLRWINHLTATGTSCATC